MLFLNYLSIRPTKISYLTWIMILVFSFIKLPALALESEDLPLNPLKRVREDEKGKDKGKEKEEDISEEDMFEKEPPEKKHRSDPMNELNFHDLIEKANDNDLEAQEELVRRVTRDSSSYEMIKDSSSYEMIKWQEKWLLVDRAQKRDNKFLIQPLEWANIAERTLKNESYAFLILRAGNYPFQQVIESIPQFIEFIKTRAAQGSPIAQTCLASMYANGHLKCPDDTEEVLKWYRLAAEQGYANAQRSLAGTLSMRNYRSGEVLSKLEEVIKQYRLAVKQGHLNAHVHLFEIYNGDHIHAFHDYPKALKYYLQYLQRLISEKIDLRKTDIYKPRIFKKNNTALVASSAKEDKEEFSAIKTKLRQSIGELEIEAGINNLNSSFQERKMAIPFLKPHYDNLVQYAQHNLDLLASFNKPGFMINCFSVPKLEQDHYKLLKRPYARSYTYKGTQYLTLGKENVQAADQLIAAFLISESAPWQASLRILRDVHVSTRTKFLAMAYEMQLKARLLQEEKIDHSEIEKCNVFITHIQEKINLLDQLEKPPDDLEAFLINHAPSRNKRFIDQFPTLLWDESD